MFLSAAAPERRTRAYRLDDMVVLAGAYHTGGCWGENDERRGGPASYTWPTPLPRPTVKPHLEGQLTGYMY